MKILIVTRSLPHHQIGGMEAVAWDLARAFAGEGEDVVVLTTPVSGRPETFEEEGVVVRTISAPPARYSRQWWRETRRLYRSELEGAFDVILSVSAGARSMVKERAARGRRPFFFLQAHGTAWGELKSKLRLRRPLPAIKAIRNLVALWSDRAYRGFDGVVAVGGKVAADLAAFPTSTIIGGLPVTKIENGIDEQRFGFRLTDRERIRAQHGLDPDQHVVISASRLHPQKGVVEGLEGFAKAAKSDDRLRMLIAGEGPSEQHLRERADALGIADKVTFAGALSREEMPAYLSAADVFLFPTKRIEGLPMNLLEALANGLPLVISPELGSDWPQSYVAPASDTALLGSRILEAVGQRAHKSLLPERRTLRYCAAAYLDLFRQAA